MSAHCTVHVQISLVGKSRCRQQVKTSGQRIFATGRIVAGARKLPLPLWIRAPRGSPRAPESAPQTAFRLAHMFL